MALLSLKRLLSAHSDNASKDGTKTGKLKAQRKEKPPPPLSRKLMIVYGNREHRLTSSSSLPSSILSSSLHT